MSSDPLVVLVDGEDREIGTATKSEVHASGALHRATSVFVTDLQGRLLIQRRAEGKYHSAGLWANTCCSHPLPGEPPLQAARRRLREEMGIECGLEPACAFVYRAVLGNGLVEHEYDHVFLGRSAALPRPDPAEVSECRFVLPAELDADLLANPGRYAPWLPLAFRELRRLGLLRG